METSCQACGECHANHEENSIWRHDVNHEDTCTANYVENDIWRHDFNLGSIFNILLI